jgi:hypothetical protein
MSWAEHSEHDSRQKPARLALHKTEQPKDDDEDKNR